jgi:pimeloyl-ACP methyl ester carboxylesterase
VERDHRLIITSGGAVEVLVQGGSGEAVLYFHGGHESATVVPAAVLYVELGYCVISVSRPGYGLTDVGPVSPANFAVLVDEVREGLGLGEFLAVVGTSFGGPQAVEYAGRFLGRARSLVLHSAAPSSRAYPDSKVQRLAAPLVFHPRVERFTWRVISGLMRTAPGLGLRVMMASLSRRPVASWLPTLDAAQRQEMREVFCAMRSGSGFVIDLRHAGPGSADARRRAQEQVACPTLVTASRDDSGVAWEHAEDFRATIPTARLVEIPAASHLFWIGPTKTQMLTAVQDFLATVKR